MVYFKIEKVPGHTGTRSLLSRRHPATVWCHAASMRSGRQTRDGRENSRRKWSQSRASLVCVRACMHSVPMLIGAYIPIGEASPKKSRRDHPPCTHRSKPSSAVNGAGSGCSSAVASAPHTKTWTNGTVHQLPTRQVVKRSSAQRRGCALAVALGAKNGHTQQSLDDSVVHSDIAGPFSISVECHTHRNNTPKCFELTKSNGRKEPDALGGGSSVVVALTVLEDTDAGVLKMSTSGVHTRVTHDKQERMATANGLMVGCDTGQT